MGRYPRSTPPTKQTNTHVLSQIRFRDLSNRAVADLRLAPRRMMMMMIIIIIINLFTAIGLLPGGSGYFTCKQNMKLVTTRFKSGGLHEKHAVATWNLESRLSICL